MMSCAVVKVSPDQPLRMVVEMLTDYPMHRVLVLKTTIFLDSSVHLTCCNRLRAGALGNSRLITYRCLVFSITLP
ncbi:MAG: hypothetical protein QGF59_03945, partial [Pirellulaceae bacterium]|nr:hypothetical protein [Pirellulaceae bacterium]